MPDRPEPPDRPAPITPREPAQRWRLVLSRRPLEGESGQREQLAAWERALAASGLPVAGLDALPPKLRFALAAPLGAMISGEGELADVWLTERMPVWRVREALTAAMPDGYRLCDLHDVWLGEAALPGQVVASVYRAALASGAVGAAELDQACRDLLAEATLPRVRQKGQGTVGYDLRPFLDRLDVDADGSVLRMTLRHDPERGVGRPDEVLAAIGERLGVALAPVSLARERLVLAQPPEPAPATRTGSRTAPRGRPRPPAVQTGRR